MRTILKRTTKFNLETIHDWSWTSHPILIFIIVHNCDSDTLGTRTFISKTIILEIPHQLEIMSNYNI